MAAGPTTIVHNAEVTPAASIRLPVFPACQSRASSSARRKQETQKFSIPLPLPVHQSDSSLQFTAMCAYDIAAPHSFLASCFFSLPFSLVLSFFLFPDLSINNPSPPSPYGRLVILGRYRLRGTNSSEEPAPKNLSSSSHPRHVRDPCNTLFASPCRPL